VPKWHCQVKEILSNPKKPETGYDLRLFNLCRPEGRIIEQVLNDLVRIAELKS